MDVIKNMATNFYRTIEMHTLNLETMQSALTSTIYPINKSTEKIRFLSYLKDLVETAYQKHAKICNRPNTCSVHESNEIALYVIKQQYENYYESLGGVSISEKPAMQYFSQGQYFDAFTALLEIIKEAKKSIILIDGYVDEKTLTYFPAKEPSISLRILTKARSNTHTFQRAIDLYNRQYDNLKIKFSERYHDRFIILDDKDFFHIGASIKDFGSKTFMFSRIEDPDIHQTIRSKLLLEWENIYS
jgi:hypothetical protein